MNCTDIELPLIQKIKWWVKLRRCLWLSNDGRSILYSVEWFWSYFSPSFFHFFFLKQHHLFWNTEWQYLLWREVNTPHSHGWTGSKPFCRNAPPLSLEDPADWICSALFRKAMRCEHVSHFCSTILSAGPLLKKINESSLILKLPNASQYLPQWHLTPQKCGLQLHNHLFCKRYISCIIESKVWLWLKSGHLSFCSYKNGTVASIKFPLAMASVILWTIFHFCPVTKGERVTRHAKSNPKTSRNLRDKIVLCNFTDRWKD